MHKDANLRKRNALVIPGGLLAFYGLMGLLYVALARDDSNSCDDRTLVVFLGACRSAYVMLAIPFIVGLALVAVGALAARNTSTCRDGHGSWTHFGLALLISLILLPLVGFVAVPSLLGADAVFTRGTVEYPVTTVLAGLTAIGLFMFIPFALLYSSQRRANPCCREKGCFDPCFCDETLDAEAPVASSPLDVTPTSPPLPVEASPASPAPAPEAVAPVPPVVEPMAPPASAAAEWKAAPKDNPAETWEVLPEEPKEQAKPDASRRSAGKLTPALAPRPTDPAAPPADAMAIAAKWAEEDEEALNELGAPRAGQSGRRRPQGKASKKKTMTKAKPSKAKKSRK